MVKNHDGEMIAQRALILQGGGALGAYEAGVLKSWCKELIKKDRENNRDGPLFDIVAGASMGAVNASLLVHNATKYRDEKTSYLDAWEKSVDDLCSFYKEVSSPNMGEPMWWVDNILLNNPMFVGFWKNWELIRNQWEKNYDASFNLINDNDHSNGDSDNDCKKSKNKTEFEEKIIKSPFRSLYFYLFPDKWGVPATPEIARRFYSYWNMLQFGSTKVISPAITQPDMKFLDPLQSTHVFARFDNDPLVKTMKEFWDYEKYPGIKTKEGEPRLLVVSVDIEDCTTATTFDSYADYAEYGEDLKYKIDLPEGITIDHVKASMSTFLRYQYSWFKAKVTENGKSKDAIRHFWDGAYIANTPANEVISKHRQYWKKQGKIPDLELYIINLYPSVEPGIPSSPDTIQDRQTDISFHDRTKSGIRIARMRTDYIDLVGKLVELAKGKGLEKDIDDILSEKARSKTSRGDERLYGDLLEGRFKIQKVVYAKRKEKDGNAIYGKAFDFSQKTISELLIDGENAGKKSFEESQKHSAGNVV